MNSDISIKEYLITSLIFKKLFLVLEKWLFLLIIEFSKLN